ncbi:MAG TPA: hypothetical protein VMV25_09950 [Steroidobacteraceae bacterium]|nr:hypothetical protein [Steroidobacteraceae bacterium]
MEWILQLADECDDALGILEHCLLGVSLEIQWLIAAVAAAGVCTAVLAAGGAAIPLAAAAVGLGAAAAVSRRRRFSRYTAP